MKKLTTIIALAVVSSLLMLSCANGSSDDTSTPKTSVYSTRLQSAISYSQPAESEESPKLLMINGDSVLSLSDKRIRQAANVIMDGNTLVFCNVSPVNVIAFGKKLKDVYEAAKNSGDEQFAARFTLNKADSWTPTHFLEQITEKMLAASSNYKISEANFDKNFYEAVGVRKNHTYFVYSLDADLLGLRFEQNVEFKSYTDNTYDGTEELEQEKVDDMEAQLKDSVEDFSNWILEKNTTQNASTSELKELLLQANQAATPSALQQIKDAAKTFTYSFPVVISPKNAYNTSNFGPFVAKYFAERRENVNVEVTVWSVCDIDHQKDYYMIKTAATCHNDQLKFMDLWKMQAQLTYGPFFKECQIGATIDPSRQTVRPSECSPETTTGSTSHTSGFSFNLGGNIGFGGAGSKGGIGGTGGASGGVTFQDTTTTSIPDIVITRNTSDVGGASWRFTGADFEPSEWIWKSDHRESVKDIQKKEATFNTYTMISLPSTSETTTENIKLSTSVQVNAFKRFPRTGIWENAIGHDCLIIKGEYTNRYSFIATVPKPNNAKGNYIMNFTPPAGASNAEIDRLQAKMKQYVSNWGDNIDFYAIGANRLDETAKNQFTFIKDIIQKNKNVFTDNNIKGTYKFYIQNVSTGTQVNEFEVTF